MKLFIFGMILFAISMVIFYFVDYIPNPHNSAQWVLVVSVSILTIGLPFWVGIIQKIFK